MYITPFGETDEHFFRTCIQDGNWAWSYGYRTQIVDVDAFVLERLRDYPFVRRFIYRRRNGAARAFAVVDFHTAEAQSCLIAGGVAPAMIGRGAGIRFTVALIDHLFVHSHVREITAVPHNMTSRRMLLRIGFADAVQSSPSRSESELTLMRADFPNCFCARILKKNVPA